MLPVNRAIYEKLIQADIEAARGCEEYEHIKLVLEESVFIYYDFLPAVAKILAGTNRPEDTALVERLISSHDRRLQA